MIESEVAEVLRCKRSYVKRLRLSRLLSYIPGRPVLIDPADLEAYISGVKVKGKYVKWSEQEEASPVSPEERKRRGDARYNAALSHARHEEEQRKWIAEASKPLPVPSTAWLEKALSSSDAPRPGRRPTLRDRASPSRKPSSRQVKARGRKSKVAET